MGFTDLGLYKLGNRRLFGVLRCTGLAGSRSRMCRSSLGLQAVNFGLGFKVYCFLLRGLRAK